MAAKSCRLHNLEHCVGTAYSQPKDSQLSQFGHAANSEQVKKDKTTTNLKLSLCTQCTLPNSVPRAQTLPPLMSRHA